MKNKYSERKKYSIHNLVKYINEQKKGNSKQTDQSEFNCNETENTFEQSEEKNNSKVKKNKNTKKEDNVINKTNDDIYCKILNKKEKNKFDNYNGNEVTHAQDVDGDDEHDNVRASECDVLQGSGSDILQECTNYYSDNMDITQNNTNEIKLFMIDYHECQNKKCSCKKLYRFKKIKRVQTNKKFKGIVLTPFCDKYFSINDKNIIETHGLSVIDCSWKSIDLIKKVKYSNQRKLPYIIAVNSINYGKPYKLSCLESLAFCLYICNYNKQCIDILNIYKWSINFINVNKELLEKYKLCSNHDQIKNAENDFLTNLRNEREEKKKTDQYAVIYEDDYI
ncbi:ribosome biogenesis protein TSR3, putative [Hepatocystis sp. ex Piliocolobus tephrosceles]|nr:ribosome biogenesis protein TSR3, putative [Hepatocystis sp. ex Piliocolobus tephrosceles]VWU48805.1 ribosome biogenesis protein TSR3, putative [Hepatocystis sp. ex Piliocolobus tephrosceles]